MLLEKILAGLTLALSLNTATAARNVSGTLPRLSRLDMGYQRTSVLIHKLSYTADASHSPLSLPIVPRVTLHCRLLPVPMYSILTSHNGRECSSPVERDGQYDQGYEQAEAQGKLPEGDLVDRLHQFPPGRWSTTPIL